MAVEIIPGFAASITNLVSDEVEAVTDIRSSDNAQSDLQFQAAIANGMSYDDQVTQLQGMIAAETQSPFSDASRLDQLQTQLTTTQALARQSDYEAKYKANLSSMALGLMTAQQLLDSLNTQLNTTTDPALRSEIQGNIDDASTDVTNYNNTILQNDQQKAVTSKSVPILQAAIQETQSHLAQMQANGDTELASVDEASLANLNSSLGSVQIQNSLNDVQVKSLTKGYDSSSKLSFLDSQIQGADSTTPVTISGQDYSSAQEYWSQLKASYIAGNNSTFATANNDFGVFSSFFNEQSTEMNAQIVASEKTNGYATGATIDAIQSQLQAIAANPDMAAYAPQVQTLTDTVMGTAVDSMATAILNDAKANEDFDTADQNLVALGAKYNVNVDAYRATNQNALASYAQSEASLTGEDPGTIIAQQFPGMAPGGGTTIPVPAVTTKAAPVDTSAAPSDQSVAADGNPTTPTPGAIHTVASGDTLSSIAAANGTTVAAITALNPTITNPNLIKVGQQVQLPGTTTPAPITPTVTPPAQTTTAPVGQQTPAQIAAAEAAAGQKAAPVAAVAPVVAPKVTTAAPSTPVAPVVAPKVTTPAVAAAPAAPVYSSYQIVQGDTLGAIATKNGTTLNAIMAANPNITNANVIKAGATINIPTAQK